MKYLLFIGGVAATWLVWKWLDEASSSTPFPTSTQGRFAAAPSALAMKASSLVARVTARVTAPSIPNRVRPGAKFGAK